MPFKSFSQLYVFPSLIDSLPSLFLTINLKAAMGYVRSASIARTGSSVLKVQAPLPARVRAGSPAIFRNTSSACTSRALWSSARTSSTTSCVSVLAASEAVVAMLEVQALLALREHRLQSASSARELLALPRTTRQCLHCEHKPCPAMDKD